MIRKYIQPSFNKCDECGQGYFYPEDDISHICNDCNPDKTRPIHKLEGSGGWYWDYPDTILGIKND